MIDLSRADQFVVVQIVNHYQGHSDSRSLLGTPTYGGMGPRSMGSTGPSMYMGVNGTGDGGGGGGGAYQRNSSIEDGPQVRIVCSMVLLILIGRN